MKGRGKEGRREAMNNDVHVHILVSIPYLQRRIGTCWIEPSSMRRVGRSGCFPPYRMQCTTHSSGTSW